MTISFASASPSAILRNANRALERIPYSLLALLARFAIAAVFWKSGQTKIEGLALDIVEGSFDWGWPRLADTTLVLFAEEYRVPLLPTELAAYAASIAEHLFPLLLLLGLATRLSALALLAMTAVIQLFVYPDAYATHASWAAVLLLLVRQGGGQWALDHWLGRPHS